MIDSTLNISKNLAKFHYVYEMSVINMIKESKKYQQIKCRNF